MKFLLSENQPCMNPKEYSIEIKNHKADNELEKPMGEGCKLEKNSN